MRWNSLTSPSMRNGRSRTSGVSTGAGEPWSCTVSFFPLIFIPGMLSDICISLADSTLAEVIAPAPANTFRAADPLLLIFCPFQDRMTEISNRWIGCEIHLQQTEMHRGTVYEQAD